MENKTSLDALLRDMAIYMKPEFLKAEHKNKINVETADNKKLNEYFRQLTCIRYFYHKLLKYKLYFEKFYPADSTIKNHEALEHHIYAYVEEMDIFRNKLKSFLGLLKNDLKKIASNKAEIEEALKEFISKIETGFKDLKDRRHPHHHSGYRLTDGDIVDAETFDTILEDRDMFSGIVNIDAVRGNMSYLLIKLEIIGLN